MQFAYISLPSLLPSRFPKQKLDKSTQQTSELWKSDSVGKVSGVQRASQDWISRRRRHVVFSPQRDNYDDDAADIIIITKTFFASGKNEGVPLLK